METAIYPPTLISSLRHKHLLLDTNIFRDVVLQNSVYTNFFNDLKSADVILATIDFVKYELLKGSASETKYQEKEKLVHDIVGDVIIPVVSKNFELAYELIKLYQLDGAAIGITDLFLGTFLMQYKQNIFLMTRDTTDFIQRIFDLLGIINIPCRKGIFTYGIYLFNK